MHKESGNVPYHKYEDVLAMAEEFRREFPRTGSIYPIEEVVELELGIELVLVPELRSRVDSWSLLTRDLGCIWVDEYCYKNLESILRFALAHEIGHARVHPEWYGSLEFGSIMEWRDLMLARAGGKDYRWAEWQAHWFAGVVLVPGAALREAYAIHSVDVRETLGDLDVEAFNPDSLFEICFDELCEAIAPTFAVSKDVIEKRLYYEELKCDFARELLGERAAALGKVWFRGP